MQEKYKQRIIGGVVVLALIIVLVPIFMRHTHSHQKQRERRNMVSIREVIPPPPQKPQVKVVKAKKIQRVTAPPAMQSRFRKDSPEYQHRAEQLPSLPKLSSEDQAQLNSNPQADMIPAEASSLATAEAKLRAQMKAREEVQRRARKLAAERERLAKSVNEQSLSPIKFYSLHKSAPKTALKAKAQSVKGAPFWVIQMGSFHNVSNVKHLVKTLRAQGYPAFIVTKRTSSARWYRVMVGPISKHQQAKETLNQLNQRTNLRGMLIEKRG